MMEAQRHRGPDGEGIWIDENAGVALGHRRLAILDPSEAGRQPMTSRDGRWTIALNGEIFNYRELRAALGGEFRSGTDTEVLLEACAAWGVEKAIERSVGMFGCALWDARNRELTLVRDRVGEKPVVYFWDGKTFAFASELRALGAFHHRELDAAAVEAYLALGYVPAPLCIFRNCKKLEPGHSLRFHDGTIEIRRWWFPETAQGPVEGSWVERIAGLRARFGEAVRQRLRADVPLALLLSGGADSSILAVECARQGARPDAFTVQFDGDEEEIACAGEVARSAGLRHEAVTVRGGWWRAELETALGQHYDEPFADSSALPSFALAKALGGRYKVVLTGDGGDEAFGGYRHYEYIAAKQRVKALAARAGFIDGHEAGRTGVYVQSKTTFRESQRAHLLNGNASPRGERGPRDAWPGLRSFPVPAGTGALKHALWTDRHLYLANDLMYKMDAALASAGIEGRAPFLDHRLLEWAQALPEDDLIRGRRKKVILREAYAGEVPPQALHQPKRGFGAPLEKWLRGPLRELAASAVPCPFFDRNSQTALEGQQLWTLVAFSCWARGWNATW